MSATKEPTRVSGPPVPQEVTLGYLASWPPYYTAERPHLGIDFGCSTGTPFVSPYLNSRVRVKSIHLVGDPWGDGSFGNMLVLDIEGTEYYAGFAHLSRIDVTVGQLVQHGQQLGLTGDTGFTSGAHLHWQHSVDQDFSRSAKTENPMSGLLITEPEPIEEEGVTKEEVEAMIRASEERTYARIDRLNDALLTRMGIQVTSLNPDMVYVEQAAEALRKAGFQIP